MRKALLAAAILVCCAEAAGAATLFSDSYDFSHAREVDRFNTLNRPYRTAAYDAVNGRMTIGTGQQNGAIAVIPLAAPGTLDPLGRYEVSVRLQQTRRASGDQDLSVGLTDGSNLIFVASFDDVIGPAPDGGFAFWRGTMTPAYLWPRPSDISGVASLIFDAGFPTDMTARFSFDAGDEVYGASADALLGRGTAPFLTESWAPHLDITQGLSFVLLGLSAGEQYLVDGLFVTLTSAENASGVPAGGLAGLLLFAAARYCTIFTCCPGCTSWPLTRPFKVRK